MKHYGSYEEHKLAFRGKRVECGECQMFLDGTGAAEKDGTFFHPDCLKRHENKHKKAAVIYQVHPKESTTSDTSERKAA